jgi:Protein of unknown function (DUF3224)
MPTTAAGTASFTFNTWEEEPIVDDGHLRIHRTRFTKRWEGEIHGRSEGELLMVHVAGRPAAYCGLSRSPSPWRAVPAPSCCTTTPVPGLTAASA